MQAASTELMTQHHILPATPDRHPFGLVGGTDMHTLHTESVAAKATANSPANMSQYIETVSIISTKFVSWMNCLLQIWRWNYMYWHVL